MTKHEEPREEPRLGDDTETLRDPELTTPISPERPGLLNSLKAIGAMAWEAIRHPDPEAILRRSRFL